MRFPLRICIYSLLFAGLTGAVVYLNLPGQPAYPAVVHRLHKTVFVGPRAVDDELCSARKEISNRALGFLNAAKYRELDAMASSFRKSQSSFSNGYWSLSLFYQALDLKTEASEQAWQNRIALLRGWFEEDTDCITPRVALARALVGYAWHARGSKWASEVQKDAWHLVYERVTEANRILEAARNLPEKCPCWYSAWMTMAMLSGASHERYDEMFTEALADFPSYTPFYFMKTWYLQEKWYGQAGEWQDFARKSADQLGGGKGDMLYAQIIWRMHEDRIYGNPIKESGVEWARVQRGFEAIQREYPDSLLALSEYCSISGFAPNGARTLMRSLFTKLNNRVDLEVWRTMTLYQRDYDWACLSTQQ